MKRKKESQLPKLKSLGAESSGFADSSHHGNLLLHSIRQIALTLRSDQPCPFYPQREMARHFHVSLSAISKSYAQLRTEGILRSVRGSKTLLEAKQLDRQLRVRAFVGLPVCLSSFETLQYYRMFLLRLTRELRLRGFAAALHFFEEKELAASFADLLAGYQIDLAVWFQPDVRTKKTIAQLEDRGIPSITVSDDSTAGGPTHYYLRRELGVREGLGDWQRNGIEKIAVAHSSGSPLHELRKLETLLQQSGIDYRYIELEEQAVKDSLAKLTDVPEPAVIFSSARLSALLSFRAPEAMFDLFANKRVMLIKGPVNTPFATVADVPVDLVMIDFQQVAEKIVSDLEAQKVFHPMESTIIDARWLPRVPLNLYAQQI